MFDVFNQFPNGVQIVSPNLTYLYVNDAFLRQLNLNRQDVLGKKLPEIYPPDQISVLFKKIQIVLDTNSTTRFQYTIHLKNGSVLDLEFKIHQLDGNVIVFTEESIENSAQDAHLDELRFEQEKFKVWFENSPNPNLIVDLGKRVILDCNKATTQLMEGTKEEIIGSDPISFSPEYQPNGELSSEMVVSHIEKLKVKGTHKFQWMHQTLKGRDFPCEISLSACVYGDRKLILAEWVDLTSIKEQELELLERSKLVTELNQKYHLAIEAVDAGFFDWDIVNDHAELSENYLALLGYRPGEVEVPSLEWFIQQIHPEDVDRVSANVQAALAGIEDYNSEFRLKCKNEEYRWFKGTGAIQTNEHDQPLLMVGSILDIHQLKNQEQSLLENSKLLHDSNMRYQLAIEAIDAGFFAWDIVNDHAELSENYLSLLGYRLGDVKVPSLEWFIKQIHPEDAERVSANVQAALSGLEDYNSEFRLNCKTLGYRWFKGTGAIERDESGKPLLMVGSILDIHDFKQLNERILDSERKFRLAAEGVGAGIFEWFMDRNEVILSDKYLSLIGYQPGEVENPNLEWFIQQLHPDDLPVVQDNLGAIYEGKDQYDIEYRLRTKEEEYIWFLGSGAVERDKEGNPVFVVGSIIDIDESKKLMSQLKESERNFQSFFELQPDPCYIMDKNNLKAIDCNRAFELCLKESKENLLGLSHLDFSPDVQSLVKKDSKQYTEELIQRLNILGEVQFEWEHIDFNGITFFCEVHLTQMYYNDEEVIVATWRDITQRLKEKYELEQAKIKAENAKNAKSLFLANMSHEIRTPMNGILGMAELLASEQISEAAREKLDIIKNSSNSLLTIINDILDYSKIEAGKLDIEYLDFDLHHFIRGEAEIFHTLTEDKGISFEYHIGDNVPKVISSDPTRIKQIVNNLLSNAMKFTSKGGIQLKVSHEEQGHQIRFQVIDSGIGIQEDSIGKLFSNFSQADGSTTRKFGGTGLGLSISKSLTELLGGEIELKSQYGHGTEVSFTIECRQVDEENFLKKQKVNSGEELENSFSQLKVLVVEDNLINKKIVFGMLSKLGIEAQHEVNGLDALNRIKSERFDICLMDCHMPVMDGYEATREIIQQVGDTRPHIIALTASAMKEDVDRCFESGMVDFLAKPLSIKSLQETLVKWPSPYDIHE